ncbi:excinuclease ABC subunit UvrC [Pumilibacter intestinalis]|uniref:excinuclease ABC subunit UvrC n=1 Tax=Pumilibacter intestinalis TaxID=2941511 RepID=UPI00204210EE|nr:excinuclease ABC subunit UvrC [Pumilibacter intestinalis]
MRSELLNEKIKGLPENPGVYIMRNAVGEIIYIGKAVVLKNRVRQYFNNSPKLPKVQAMVDNIADFEYVITLTEKDALTLEANLVKKHKPKYNILLKDDKHSPYIKINTALEFPALEVTRKLKKDGSKYFGPYFNGINVRDVVNIIKTAYGMRTCNPRMKVNKNSRECLDWFIGLCKAPCTARVTAEQYRETVEKVIAFLSGKDDTAESLIEERMNRAAENEDFERAITYRNQLGVLKKLNERTVANLGNITDIDLFGYVSDGSGAAVSVCIVRGGKMMGVRNYFVTDAGLGYSDTVTGFMGQYYRKDSFIPPLVCLPEEIESAEAIGESLSQLSGKKVEIAFPKIGAKRSLIVCAEQNAADFLEKSSADYKRKEDMTSGACERLAGILGIASARRMECYDISNISGVDKVSSQVVFINGEPSKADYRKYKIKTVEGANDFASMEETLKRRFSRAKEGDEKFAELPDLIVIDGGKGQLSFAHEAMLSLGYDVPMVGLAKREEEIFTVGSSTPILLSKQDNALKLLQRIRDEAHRFAITYHRTLRKTRYVSMLEKIPGVGPKKAKILLAAFADFNDIKEADEETLCAVDGIDKRCARSVCEYFKNKAEE